MGSSLINGQVKSAFHMSIVGVYDMSLPPDDDS